MPRDVAHVAHARSMVQVGFFTSLVSLVMLDPYIHTAHGEHSKLGWEVKKRMQT